jgi:hypothetical protein
MSQLHKEPFAFDWEGFQHKVPILTESSQGKYITYGVQNDYPYYLLDMFRRSAKHNAIVTGKVQYILGQGWHCETEGSALEKAKTDKWVKNSSEGEGLNKLAQKLITDFEIYNGFAICVTWARNGSIHSLTHIPFEKVRKATNNENTYYVAEWFSPDGSRRFPSSQKVDTYNAFDPEVREGQQLYYYRCYSAGIMTYPLPDYLGGLAWIEADVEIANFHNNNLRNNFWGGYLINFPNGVPSKEKQADIERSIKRKWGGTNNAGRFIVNFSDDSSKAPTLTALTPSSMDKQFEMLNDTIQQEIFVAHKVTSPLLFGIKTEGQLGGRNELVEAYELFKEVYVSDRAQQIEYCINNLLAYCPNVLPLKLKEKAPIAERWTEGALLQIMTLDEQREKAGLPKLNVDQNTGADLTQPTAVANDNIKKLSGREYQNMMRIIRHFNQSKITREQAVTMLKSGFGLSDDEVLIMLGATEAEAFNSVSDDNITMLSFALEALGSQSDRYEVLYEQPLKVDSSWGFEQCDNFVFEQEESHKRIKWHSIFSTDQKSELSFKTSEKIDADVAKYLKDNPNAKPREIAKELKLPIADVVKSIQNGIDSGKIDATDEIRQALKDATEGIKPIDGEQIKVMYKYAWSPEFPIVTNEMKSNMREFCKEMLKLNKLYSRSDINAISQIVGYSVWNRRGGWYTNPDTGIPRPQCRHIWLQQIVVEKDGNIFKV